MYMNDNVLLKKESVNKTKEDEDRDVSCLKTRRVQGGGREGGAGMSHRPPDFHGTNRSFF